MTENTEKLTAILDDERVGIKKKFIRINNVLKEYIEDVNRDAYKIDSDRKKKVVIRAALNQILKYIC